jgi:hypothetical protein
MTEEQEARSANEEPFPRLDAVEARVLGCLMEKQRTTPDSYPLTLNALVQACNQKSSRNPVMSLDPGEVGHCVNRLRDRALIHASFSGRTERYDHKMASSYQIDRREQALICALLLRGPQTPGELRTNAGRLAQFDTLEDVEGTLRGLEERDPPLLVRLPRLPGKREERFAHLLCGEVTQEPVEAAPPLSASAAGGDRMAALEAQVADLRRQLDALWALTGLADQRPPRAD